MNLKLTTTTGNGPARALRRRGKLPAVLYGPTTEPVLLSVDINDLNQALRKSGAGLLIFNLAIHNGEQFNRSAMIKELQTDPVSGKFLHVDFYEIAMDRKIKVKVPVIPKGKAPGLEHGGVLQIIRHELEVLCLPHEIPDAIEIDINGLDIGDAIHVKEIPLEGHLEIPAEVNFTVLTIGSPRAAEGAISEVAEIEEEELQKAAGEEETSEEGGAPE